jgi:hypothetical protein
MMDRSGSVRKITDPDGPKLTYPDPHKKNLYFDLRYVPGFPLPLSPVLRMRSCPRDSAARPPRPRLSEHKQLYSPMISEMGRNWKSTDLPRRKKFAKTVQASSFLAALY